MRRASAAAVLSTDAKITDFQLRLAGAQRLVSVAEILIAGKDEQIPECATDALDPEIRLQIAHMCSLKPEQVELKRLKYLEKQAKYTLKVAECKANLSGLKNDSNGEKDVPGTTLKEKVGKYRGQIAETDVRLACTQRLVDVAEMFIAQGKDAQVGECVEDVMDPSISPEIAKMRTMNPAQLEVCRLIYVEKHAKYLLNMEQYKFDLAKATKDVADTDSSLMAALKRDSCVILQGQSTSKKLHDSELNLSLAQRLVVAAEIFMEKGNDSQLPDSAVDHGASDSEFGNKINEMRAMPRAKLQLKLLKWQENVAKLVRKVAEYKADLAEFNVEEEESAAESAVSSLASQAFSATGFEYNFSDQYRAMIAETEMRLACAQRIVQVAEVFLSEGKNAEIPDSTTDAMVSEIAIEIANMRDIKPEKLKIMRVKYLGKQAKYKRKIAEFRLELSNL